MVLLMYLSCNRAKLSLYVVFIYLTQPSAQPSVCWKLLSGTRFSLFLLFGSSALSTWLTLREIVLQFGQNNTF